MVNRRSRSKQRGAAMFVVLMVILILSGIGTFALSNARYEVQAAGFSRYRYVSQEVAQLGGTAALAEVGGSSRASAYISRMRTPPAGVVCKANQGLIGAPCYHLYLTDIERSTGLMTEKLFRPAIPASGVPGSLGLNNLTGGFVVQLTEPLEITKPEAGYNIQTDQGASGVSSGAQKFFDLTLTSTAVVFPDGNANGIIDYALGEGSSAVFTEGRGHLVVGPIFDSSTAPTTTSP